MDYPTPRRGDALSIRDWNKMLAQMRSNTLCPGPGYTLSKTTGGTVIRLAQQPSTGRSEAFAKTIHPFKVVAGYDFNGCKTLRVAGQSYLQNIESGVRIPIQDLGAVIGGPNDNEDDQGQFSIPPVGHMIWLTVEVYNLVVVSAYIEHGMPGTANVWKNFPSPIQASEDDIPECRYSRIAIAEIHGEGEDVDGDVYTIGTGQNPQIRIVRQLVNTHLGVKLGVINYIVSPIIMPWAAPGRVTWTP
jgi:hypothetical protein